MVHGNPRAIRPSWHGRALLADVLRRGKLEGASIGLLGATPAGKPLYDATGWTTLEGWRLFLSSERRQWATAGAGS